MEYEHLSVDLFSVVLSIFSAFF